MKKGKVFSIKTRLPLLALVSSFLAAVIITLLSPQVPGAFSGPSYAGMESGMIAERTLTAGKALSYELPERTELLREEARENTASIFLMKRSTTLTVIKRFNRFSELLFSYGNDFDEAFLQDIQSLFGRELSPALQFFFTERGEQVIELVPLIEEMVREVMKRGLFKQEELQGVQQLLLHRFAGPEKEVIQLPLEEGLTKNDIPFFVEEALSPLTLEKEKLSFISSITSLICESNAVFDPLLTEEAKKEAAAAVSPVTKRIEKGEQVVGQGELITKEISQKIDAISSESGRTNHFRVLGSFLHLLLLFFLGWKLLYPHLNKQMRSLQNNIILLSSWLLFYLYAALLIPLIGSGITPLRSFFLPTALLAMIITSMIGRRTAFLLILLSAFSLFPLASFGKADLLFIMASGLIGIQVIIFSEKRIDLVRGSLLITAVHCLLVIIIGLIMQQEFSWILFSMAIVTVNAFISTMLNLVFLPILEHVTNAPTVFRLIELSDTSTPLFDRLLITAPGTYNHSMSVASMSESAARAIGARHLLARVGALYHDIGKIEQPGYFIENQTGSNKHDELKPSLSVAVIKSHVKLGIEKAKELKLPQEVVDIVGQHHGNGLIEYFYMEARKGEGENGKVNPEEYSYNGRPPTSRESAIVMLADTIEASTRTLKKPTIAKLEKYIWSRIMDRLTNRQLMNSDLTFSDLEKIKQSFVQILAGQFHSRIEYPKMEEGNNKTNE